jgi:nitrogen permease regulator 2-like protein
MASFPRLVSLFYATFDSNKGAKILVQAPDDAINTTASSLFDFNSISEFIIPKRQLCNRLITITTPSGHRIVGFPVHIPGPQYERYLFIYNLVFVFDERGEIGSYIPVVRRLAMTFKQLEVFSPRDLLNARNNPNSSLKRAQDLFCITLLSIYLRI